VLPDDVLTANAAPARQEPPARLAGIPVRERLADEDEQA